MRRASSLLAATLLCAVPACSGDDDKPSTGSGTTAAPAASATRRPSATASAKPPALKKGTPRLEKVAEADDPVHLTAPAGDQRVYVVERSGRVVIVDGGRVLPEPFLDISDDVLSGGEQGLLSIAFSPSYADDGLVYAYYTDDDGDSRVIELRRGSGDQVDPRSRRELIKIDQPFSNHNGGLVLFDPSGRLLIGLGDGGSGGDPGDRAQDPGELLGKILRIDPKPAGNRQYGIPTDNPFVRREGARAEIWALGLRNPWRFSFDDKGNLYVADVGQNAEEEVSVVSGGQAGGANYGWSAFEGKRPFEPDRLRDIGTLVRPALTYGRDNGRCTVIGGGVYRGTVADLRDHYIYGDYCSREIWAAKVDGVQLGEPRRLPFDVSSLSSFGVDGAGEMYAVSLDGPVYRITAG